MTNFIKNLSKKKVLKNLKNNQIDYHLIESKKMTELIELEASILEMKSKKFETFAITFIFILFLVLIIN